MSYLDFLKKTRKRNGEKLLPKTIALYLKYVEKYEEEFSKYKDISKLIEYMNILIKRQGNLYIKASFKYYLFYIGVDENDKILKMLKSPKRRATALSSVRMLGEKSIPLKDMKVFYSKLNNEWKLIISVLYETAIRESEFLNIRKKDITFYRTKKNLGAEILVLGKGKKYRTVYISEKTVILLKKLKPDLEDVDKLFQFKKDDGKLYARQEKYLIDKMKKYTKEFIGKEYTPHSLRHSRSSHLADDGFSVNAISSLLGHQNLSTTQIYLHNSKKVAHDMCEKSVGDL